MLKHDVKIVLIENDLNNILNADLKYKDDINHLKNKVLIYTIVWVISLALFFTALYLSSNYLNSQNK
jgi:hypothetical protein